MANKKFWSGMLILALVFGTAIIGCDNAANAGSVGGSGGGSNAITYTVEADGAPETETSTKLTFTFSVGVKDLKVENIDIFDNTGSAEKNGRAPGGALTGSGEKWILNITKVREGRIRVSIDKKGIERGRKTVFVYTDTATGESKEEAITLYNTQWAKGYLSGRQAERWYKFEAEAGSEYRVSWKDKHGTIGVNEWAYVDVTAYKSDGTTSIGTYDRNPMGVATGLIISGETGVVYLEVTSSDGGNFEIRFVDTTTMGPKDDIGIFAANATLNFSVVVEWLVRPMNSTDPSIESTGYKVYRSETENGTYRWLDDVPANAGVPVDRQSYTNTGLEAGKTYWYRVSGFNSKGEGEMSEPKESTLVQDPDDGTTLLELGVETEGKFLTVNQVDLYKFTAQSGKTYVVEWEKEPDSPPMGAAISAYRSDKTLIDGYHGNEGETLSGVSGTVYLQVGVNPYWYGVSGGYLGPYSIKIVIKP